MRLFLRWRDGRLTRSEKRRLDAWLDESSDNRREWEQMGQTWKAGEELVLPEARPAEEQWEDFRQKIDFGGAEASPRKRVIPNTASGMLHRSREIKSPYRLAIYAMGVLGLLIAGYAIFEGFGTGASRWTAPYGQMLTLRLPDETVVDLGPGSELSLGDSFSEADRRISLSGEAFFTVTANEKPFIVTTDRLEIRVTGTAFNVRTWDDSKRVFVLEGRVEVRGGQDLAALELGPGQSGVLANDSLYVETRLRAEEALGWRKGHIFFIDAPFIQVLADLERMQNTVITADQGLLRHRITASFTEQGIDEILEVLAQAIGAEVRKTQSGYRFTAH